MIDEFIKSYLSKQIREPREHKEKFYPSQSSCYINFPKYKKLHGKCLRASYYSCMGLKEDKDTEISMKTQLGKAVEKMLIEIIRSEGRLKEKRVSFFNEKYNISGELDAIIISNEEEYGLEIKSIGGENIYINSLIFNSKKPKWQDLFQTVVYCYCFKDKLPNGFILLYIRRDTGETKEFKVQVEPYNGKLTIFIDGLPETRFLAEDILERYKHLSKYIKANKVPPKEYMSIYPMKLIPEYYKVGLLSKKQVDKYNISPFGDPECRFCNYKNSCDKED